MSTFEPVQCPILVGRDDVLSEIDRRLAELANGHGGTLLLAGEAGIGKTRLVGVIRRQAQAAGIRTTQAEVAPQDHDVPLAALRDLFRTLRLTPAYTALGDELLARCDAAMADGGRRYSRALVLDLVDRFRATIDAPTAFIFEDLQWADDISLEAIGELARRAGELPLLVVGAYRLDETMPGTPLRDWRARLLTQRLAEEVRLEHLDHEATGTMTTLLLGTGLPAPRDVVDEVYRRSDGVPLHVEELLATVRAAGPVDATAIRDAAVPDAIEDVVLARIAHRSPDAQAIARAGAVLGRCFVPEVLAGVVDRPVDDLEGPLRELVEHGVLQPIGSVDPGYFDFRHQLIRDALYRSTPALDQRRYHARAGEFGAQLQGASEVHASLHYERAGRRPDAYRAALAGADEATRLSAHREAFVLYQRAVDNRPADLPDLELGALYEHLSDEAGAIEHNDIAVTAAERASAAYRAAGNEDRALLILGNVHAMYRRMGRPLRDRRALVAAVLAGLEALPPSRERDDGLRWTRYDELVVAVDSMDLEAARRIGALVGAEARAAQDHALELGVAGRLAMVEVISGNVDVGLAAMVRVAEDARAAGFEEAGVTAFRDVAVHACRVHDYGEARRSLAEGLSYADSIQQSHCAHVMAALQAEVAWADGRWDEAVAVAQQVIVDPGCTRAPAMARWSLGAVLVGRGEVERARVILADALDFGDRSEQVEWRLTPRWGLAEAALAAGATAEAVRWCDDTLAIALESGDRAGLVPVVVTAMRAYLADGHLEGATRWLATAEAHLDATPSIGAAALHHGRGLVALSGGSTGAARTELEAAVAGWDACGRIWEATLARLDLAGCLIRTNRFAAGVAVAVQARSVAEMLPSPALLARADALIRHGKGRFAEDEPWRPLTAREFAVARLIAAGNTNGQIADELGIAPKTASSHVEHILAKLGASRRAEIAAWVATVDRGATLGR